MAILSFIFLYSFVALWSPSAKKIKNENRLSPVESAAAKVNSSSEEAVATKSEKKRKHQKVFKEISFVIHV